MDQRICLCHVCSNLPPYGTNSPCEKDLISYTHSTFFYGRAQLKWLHTKGLFNSDYWFLMDVGCYKHGINKFFDPSAIYVKFVSMCGVYLKYWLICKIA